MHTQTDTATAIAGVGGGHGFTGHEEPAIAARRGQGPRDQPATSEQLHQHRHRVRSDHARHPDRANTYLLTAETQLCRDPARGWLRRPGLVASGVFRSRGSLWLVRCGRRARCGGGDRYRRHRKTPGSDELRLRSTPDPGAVRRIGASRSPTRKRSPVGCQSRERRARRASLRRQALRA